MRDEKRINVVIIDDMTSNLVELAKIVSDMGYIARPVVSIKQAWKALKVCEPTVILLDIAMPEMSGFDFYHRLRQKPIYAEVPVIFVSAYDDIAMKQEAFLLGAADFVTRPFQPEELALRIKRQVMMIERIAKLTRQNMDLQQMLLSRMDESNDDKRRVLDGLIYYVRANEVIPGHMRRVSEYSKKMASTMLLLKEYETAINSSFINVLEVASMLHDIGLSCLNPEFLKQEEYTRDERTELREHTTYGVEPLRMLYAKDEDNEYLKMAIEIAMYHHERFDGTGYPYGLKGDEIPLSAQIVSLVSLYDELTHDTFDQIAYSPVEAEALIMLEEGKQFDPQLIRAFHAIHLSDFLDKEINEEVN